MEHLSHTSLLSEDGAAANDGDETTTTITKLTLNRPQKANAMGRQFLSELQDCLNHLNSANATDCRCVVLTSSSERVFSAGADLKERATMNQDETRTFVSLLRSTMQQVAELPMPVIAAVDGVALGGGLELALAADLRVVSSRASLGLPETSLAILPGAGGTQRLPRLIGPAKAKELIWTAQKITAFQALEYGLVNEVVVLPDDDNKTDNGKDETTASASATASATARALQMAAHIASNGPVAIRASKVAIQQGGDLECLHKALELEGECYAKVVPTNDRLEGLRAFREKRTPSYKGE